MHVYGISFDFAEVVFPSSFGSYEMPELLIICVLFEKERETRTWFLMRNKTKIECLHNFSVSFIIQEILMRSQLKPLCSLAVAIGMSTHRKKTHRNEH